MKAALLVLVVLLGSSGPATAAEKPIGVASADGTGTATLSANGADRWHVVVTTRPAGLRVLVRVAGRPDRVGKSPVVLDYKCSACAIRVTARLAPAGSRQASGTVRAALYRR